MPPEYYKLRGVVAKSYFFNYFANKVRIENMNILKERQFILSIKSKKDFDESSKEYKRLINLQKNIKSKIFMIMILF